MVAATAVFMIVVMIAQAPHHLFSMQVVNSTVLWSRRTFLIMVKKDMVNGLPYMCAKGMYFLLLRDFDLIRADLGDQPGQDGNLNGAA